MRAAEPRPQTRCLRSSHVALTGFHVASNTLAHVALRVMEQTVASRTVKHGNQPKKMQFFRISRLLLTHLPPTIMGHRMASPLFFISLSLLVLFSAGHSVPRDLPLNPRQYPYENQNSATNTPWVQIKLLVGGKLFNHCTNSVPASGGCCTSLEVAGPIFAVGCVGLLAFFIYIKPWALCARHTED